MVRNWQSRVEIASARRNISKQKKVKVDHKRQWKLFIQEFQSALDRILNDPKCCGNSIIQQQHNNHTNNKQYTIAATNNNNSKTMNDDDPKHSSSATSVWKLHIWTDTMPQSSSASSRPLPIDEDDDNEADDDDDDDEESPTDDFIVNHRHEETIPDIIEDLRKRMRSKSLGDCDDHDNNHDNDTQDYMIQMTPTKGRARSNSTTTTTTTRTTSYPHNGKKKKKKIHPRSHSNNYNNVDTTNGSISTKKEYDNSDISMIGTTACMCRSYFYTGSCDYVNIGSPRLNVGRKGTGGGGSSSSSSNSIVAAAGNSGCRYLHGCCCTNGNIQLNRSLYHVVGTTGSGSTKCSTRSNYTTQKELQRSNHAELEYSQSFAKSSLSSEVSQFHDGGTAMDMLYYIQVDVVIPSQQENGNGSETKQPSEIISEVVTNLQLYLASITYIAINSVLVYDRYRNGLLYNTDQDLIMAIINPSDTLVNNYNDNQHRRRGSSIVGDADDNKPESMLPTIDLLSWNYIPDTILVHILMFIHPDHTVAWMSLVCKHWYDEIQSSHIIWKNMLDNRSWQEPKITPRHVMISPNPTAREIFCQHYTILRDMKALKTGLDALLGYRHTNTSSKEMTFRKFATTTKKHHSPTHPTKCISMRNWSTNRTLVAYDRDCTVRLFETQPGDSNNALCKEIICQKFDPYRNTKKRTCVILSMDLDEHFITCLGQVTGSASNAKKAYVLLVMNRDDYLLGDTNDTTVGSCGYSEDMSNVTVIDIHEAVHHYIVSLDEVHGAFLHLKNFLEEGGSMGEVTIDPSNSITSCGHGRIMFDVKMMIPDNHVDDDGYMSDESYVLIQQMSFLFSSTAGAIVWSHDSTEPEWMNDHESTFVSTCVSCFRRPEGPTLPTCYFVVRSAFCEHIITGEIDPTGWVNSVTWRTVEQCTASPQFSDWLIHDSLMILSITGIIFANSLCKRRDDMITDRKVVLSFLNRSEYADVYHDFDGILKCTYLEISGNFTVVRLSLIRDDYIAMICRSYTENDEQHFPTHYTVVIVHIPSQEEICRTVLCDVGCMGIVDLQPPERLNEDVPLLTHDCTGTVGLSLSWEGIVMTGHDVRQVIESSATTRQKQHKKKPHLRNNQGYKKDGFRLGKK